MREFKDLRVRITGKSNRKYDGVAVKISDGFVWMKLDNGGPNLVQASMEDVEIIYDMEDENV